MSGAASAGAKIPAAFELVSENPLEEFHGKGIFLRHRKTGCEVYHLLTGEADNLFSFTFKTPPQNDTGVAHILEHSVLCGSEKFPVKDPFLLLLKGSMNTYMNASTFPDKTVYPASSQVEEDFYNLFRVYGDAVFFPLLRREAFMQEGQRREIAGGKLSAVGIVYNEMKGNYSTHESIAAEWAYRSLFPDTPYAFDSGGEPGAILNLSYEEFTAFHAAYYHPSNCRIFLYGNIPTEKHLVFLEENFLSRFERREIRPELPFQPRWKEPRFLEKAYPAGEGETVDGASSVTVNWLLPPVTDPLKVLSLEILTEIFLGNSGSPLQKALLDSGLGEDLSAATGIETETRELTFSVGLRGTSPARRGDIEKLIFSVLENLSVKGIDPEQVEGAVRCVEFRIREVKAGSAFGRGLMRRALRGWLHGLHPEVTMCFRNHLEELKAVLKTDKRYFEKLIAEELLSNPHRTTLLVKPDTTLAGRQEEETRKRLDAEGSSLGEDGMKRLEEEIAAFQVFQETPDSPEALASIPSLRLDAIPRELENIPSAKPELAGIREAYAHDLYTNGIVYADFAFDLDGGGETLRSADMFMSLYAAALAGVGAGGKSYDRIALELSLKTGGFHTQVEAGFPAAGDGRPRRFLFLRLKSLEEGFAEAMDLMKTIVLEPDFDDAARMRNIFLEYRNDFKSSIIPNGHAYASARAESRLSSAEKIEEQWKGLSQYEFAAAISAKKAAALMRENFAAITGSYINREKLIVNFTAPEKSWKAVGKTIEEFAAALPEKAAVNPAGGAAGTSSAFRLEGIAVPSSVGFAASAVRASRLGQTEHAHESVLAHLLSTGLLWEKIRMKGGAYGASCSALGRDGVFAFASYRDPNIAATFTAFREAVGELAANGVLLESAKNAVIGTAARETRPLSPGGKSMVGFRRGLYGISDSLRRRHQDAVLSTRPEDIAAAAKRIEAAFDEAYSAVIAGKDALAAASEALPDLKANTREISL